MTTTGFPDATSAGIVAGTVLTNSGNVVVNTPGVIIQNLNITGTLRINANNVTVRNCKLVSDDIDVILIAVGVTGTLIYNCDIDGLSAGGQGIAGTGTYKNNNIHNCADGMDVRGDNTWIEENYIHNMGGSAGSHLDGIQADGGFANLTIKNNTIINEQDQTSAIMLDNYWGPIANTNITGNLACGGDYAVYINEIAMGQNPGGPVTGTVFSNNHLGTGTFGFYTEDMQLGNVVISSGNVNDGGSIKNNLQTTGQPAAPLMISGDTSVPNSSTYTTGGQNISGQMGMPLYGISGTPPFTGNYFFVNENSGSDGNTGGPQDPLKTLTKAMSFCVDGNNDVIFLTGTVHVTSTVNWSKSKTHLIGLGPELSSQARARISQTGSSVFTPLVNVTAQECIFQNIGTFHGFADISAQICWVDAGGRNQYQNCAFLGMGDVVAASQAGSRSLLVTGPTGENTFTQCTIGLDTIIRTTNVNASLEFTASSPRNVFRQCLFAADAGLATELHVLIGSGGIDRYVLFQGCTFMNSTDSGGVSMNAAFTVNATAGGSVLLQYCTSHGATVYATTGPIYVDGAVPTGTTSGLAVAAT